MEGCNEVLMSCLVISSSYNKPDQILGQKKKLWRDMKVYGWNRRLSVYSKNNGTYGRSSNEISNI